MNFKRVFLIVLDSLGVGEAKDASIYNDVGANTLGHINEKYNNLRSSYLKDADDLEFSSVEVWKQLDNIEKMRSAELSRLASEYAV